MASTVWWITTNRLGRRWGLTNRKNDSGWNCQTRLCFNREPHKRYLRSVKERFEVFCGPIRHLDYSRISTIIPITTNCPSLKIRTWETHWKGYFWNPGFRYKNKINYFLSLSSSGLIETIRRRYLPHAYRKDITQINTEQKINIDLFRNLFVMYAGCLLVFVFTVVMECLMPIGQKFAEKYQKRSNDR